MFLQNIGRTLWWTGLASLCVVSLACSDSHEGSSPERDTGGWGFDAGADSSTDAEGDTAADIGSEPTCEVAPPLPMPDGVSEQVLLVNAGWGEAYGHTQRGSTWAVAQIFEDGRIELGDEHVFDEEEPVEMYESGERAYVAGQLGLRVVVLDATRGFEVRAEHFIPAPAGWAAEQDPIVISAAYSKRFRRHYFALSEKPFIAFVDECAEPTTAVNYIDLSDTLGAEAEIEQLYAVETGFVVGTVLRNGRKDVFVLDARTHEVVDQDLEASGLQLLELPFWASGSHFKRVANGDLAVSTSPGPIGTANQEISGGLLRLEKQDRPGAYRLGSYLVTGAQLEGNVTDFALLASGGAVAVVHDESGLDLHGVGWRDDAVEIGQQIEQDFVHVCSNPTGRLFWVPASDRVYPFIVDGDQLRSPTMDAQPSMVPHNCMFAP